MPGCGGAWPGISPSVYPRCTNLLIASGFRLITCTGTDQEALAPATGAQGW